MGCWPSFSDSQKLPSFFSLSDDFLLSPPNMGFPCGSVAKNSPAMQETRVWPLAQEDPLEKGMAATPAFLPRELHGQRSLEGYSPWSCKESDTTEQLTHLNLCWILSIQSLMQNNRCVMYSQRAKMLVISLCRHHLLFLFHLLAYNQEDVVS